MEEKKLEAFNNLPTHCTCDHMNDMNDMNNTNNTNNADQCICALHMLYGLLHACMIMNSYELMN